MIDVMIACAAGVLAGIVTVALCICLSEEKGDEGNHGEDQ